MNGLLARGSVLQVYIAVLSAQLSPVNNTGC